MAEMKSKLGEFAMHINNYPLHPKDVLSKIDKQVIYNIELADRIQIFEILEDSHSTIVRFYSTRIYIFPHKNYRTSFAITLAMKKDIYKTIIDVFSTNGDALRMHKDDLNSLYNIKESYFDEKSSGDAFTLGKELLKNIFDKTRDKILAS